MSAGSWSNTCDAAAIREQPVMSGADYDVVVVGFGFAGGVAAIAAHDACATVRIAREPFLHSRHTD